MEALLSWLRETEAQMDGGMAEKGDSHDPLTKQLSLCKVRSQLHFKYATFLSSPANIVLLALCFLFLEELQSFLLASASEVNGVAFDIQVFVSERAQDLAPEQSRRLLGQLQQLQRDFHRASGRAQAWADALSAQRGREEERERQSAKQREVWSDVRLSYSFSSLIHLNAV